MGKEGRERIESVIKEADQLNTKLLTVKPPIKDTTKEDKPPNKGQAESILVYTLYRKSLLKEDNLSSSIKDKMAGPESVLIKRFHCSNNALASPL